MSPSCCPWRVGRSRQKMEQDSLKVTKINSAPTRADAQVPVPDPKSQPHQEHAQSLESSALPVIAKEKSGETPSLPVEHQRKEAPSELSKGESLPNSHQETSDATHDKFSTTETSGAAGVKGKPKTSTEPILSGLRRAGTDAEPTKDLWSNAYDELKSNEKTRRLMDTYEKILSSEKLHNMMTEKDGDNSQNIDTDAFDKLPNMFANLKRDERVKKMQEIAEKGFEKMEKQVSSKVSKGMTEVTKLVNNSKSFIKEALKGSESASLAWAGVCVFILPAIINGFEQLEEQRKGLDYVNNRIKWYTGLHDILLSRRYWKDIHDPKFESIYVEAKKAVQRLYCCLIEYQVRCVCTLFAKFGRIIINTLRNIIVWDDWSGKIEEIEKLEVQLKDHASTLLAVKHQDSLSSLVHQGQNQVDLLSKIEAAIKTMVETNAQSNREQTERRSRKQLALFDGTKYKNTLDQLVAIRKEHTGNWLLEHSEFKRWESSEGGLLIVEANPGRGKSVLAKTIVGRLMDDTTKTTCYFFFTGRVENQNKAKVSLRALLHQIFTKRQEILEGIGNEIEKKNESFTDDFDSLWEIFILATKKSARGEIICILDALDECNQEDGKLLLQRLGEGFKDNMPFRMLITTRPNDELRSRYKLIQTHSVINLEEENARLQSLSEDINAVIDQRYDILVDKHRSKTPIPQRKHETYKNILKGDVEQRTYLWVDLIFKYLDAVASPGKPSGWDRVFEKLPDTYSTVYEDFLQTVPPENQANVREIFELVAVAVEPLSVQNINVAANIEYPRDVEGPSDLEMSSSDGFKNWINSNCGFLVHVYDGKLYFIHQTAREFLLLSPNRSEPVWLRSLTLQTCHRLAAERCIAYLSSRFLIDENMKILPIEDINSEGRDGTLEQYPFFVYSALYWLTHVTYASGNIELSIDQQRNLIHTILNNVTLENAEDLAKRLIRISTVLGTGYLATGARPLLMVSIGIAELAIRVVPSSHPYLPDWQQTLGKQLVLRFERSDSVGDLSRAIELARYIVSETPIDHPSLVSRVDCLANWLGKRFERTGDIADLKEALSLLERATSHLPVYSSEEPNHLDTLGYLLGRDFEITSNSEHLEKAIGLTRTAIDRTPKESQALFSRLENLSAQLGMRFTFSGNIEDLDDAIRLAEEIMYATPRDDVRYAEVLQVLSNHLAERYKWNREMHDLDHALELMGEAVDLTPEHHPAKANRLAILAERIGRKFERTGAVDDLARAIQCTKAALDHTPEDHPDQARTLSTLGDLLGQRFERTGDISDLDWAIELANRGLMMTPSNHTERARRLNILGYQIARRFKRTEDQQDIDLAIHRAEESVHATPKTHPDKLQHICTLVDILQERFVKFGDGEDLEKATSYLDEVWDSRDSASFSLIRLLRSQAELLATGKNWEASNRLLSKAVHCLPSMIPRWLPLTEKHYLLSEFGGLASTAASVALNAGESAFDALQLLERGRAIIASQQLESSIDMVLLEHIQPDLATKFVTYQRELDMIANRDYDDTPKAKLFGGLEYRRETEKKLDILINRIRTNPGFERFQLPPTKAELMAAATPDPIVVLNTSLHRSDAFIIEHRQITALPLPDISPSEIEERARRRNSSSTLRWLWDNITSPCLKALGYDKVPADEEWPHVWWIPTGPFSLLPIHAAGVHTKDSIDTVIDRVMSSYSLSVKTLMSLRKRRARQNNRPGEGNSLIVTMLSTPGNFPLQHVLEEGKMVEHLYASMNWSPVVLRDPSGEQVLQALKSSDLFHFAGNAKSDKSNPVESALLLSDWETAPMTVADLSRLKRERGPAFLSFLSTCDVASVGDRRLDEPMHLVGACLISGFQHAIGALDEVADEDCYQVAKVFYESLQKEGIMDRAVYRALHKSVKRMRDEEVQDDTASDYDSEPDCYHRDAVLISGRDHRWASFVHFGV